MTVTGIDTNLGESGATPRLRVTTDLGEVEFALDAAEFSLGRHADNEIVIDSGVVSAFHARLVREGTTYRFVQLGATNPTLLRGVPITDLVLHDSDRLEIAPGTPGAVTLLFTLRAGAVLRMPDVTRVFKLSDATATAHVDRLKLPESGTITIGRAPENDLVLPSLSVSRRHARLELENGTASLVDAESANGTYVNGAAAQHRALVPGDIVRIGPYKLVYHDGVIEHHDDSRAVRLDVHGVSKLVSGKKLLDAVSMSALPGEVVAIAGTSGAGKSTLIDALNGMRPPTSGRVLINGADLYLAYEALRPLIGYVPQESILPAQLTVGRALHYVALLRLPPDVSGEDAASRVDEVMRELELYDRRDVRIARLSGGQQKRASIAAELIGSPGLFFLDEATSGLDPGLTRRVTGIIRALAAGGSTVVIISHDVESLQAADRIVFLAAGGRVVFIGTPPEALVYFDVTDFADIYPLVESRDAAGWEEQFRASQQYRTRVAPTLARGDAREGEEPASIDWDPFSMIGAGVRRGASAWRQFRLTTTRYVESMLADRTYLAVLLLQAPVVGLALALVSKNGDFHPPPAAAAAQAVAFGIPAAKLAAALPLMLAASATWFGAINAAKEIVKERPVLRRERLAGLRVAPYLSSKVVVLALLSLLQTSALLGIVWLRVPLPSSGAIMWGPLELWITLFLAAIAALGLGLVISATMTNADRATSLVPLLLIPQLIFLGGPGSGAVGRWISYFMITHWSVEALKLTAGIPYNASATGFGATDLLIRWGALALMSTVFVTIAAWQLARNRTA